MWRMLKNAISTIIFAFSLVLQILFMNKAIPECIMSLVGEKIHARWCMEMYIFNSKIYLSYQYKKIILLNISIYCVLSIYLNTIHICVYFAPYLCLLWFVHFIYLIFYIANIYILNIYFSRLCIILHAFFSPNMKVSDVKRTSVMHTNDSMICFLSKN